MLPQNPVGDTMCDQFHGTLICHFKHLTRDFCGVMENKLLINTSHGLNVTGNNAQIMDLETYETFDVEIPEEMKDKVVQGAEINYWVLMGRKMLVSGK